MAEARQAGKEAAGDPAAARALAAEADRLVRQGRLSEALQAYDAAVAADPALVPAWTVRGQILIHRGRWLEAAASLEAALRHGGEQAGTLVDYGVALWNAGRPEAALQAYDRAVAADPQLALAWTNRGTALLTLDRHEEALRDFARAIALQPQDGRYRFNRAAALLELARHEEALEDLEAAMALAPDLPNARLSAAFACLATGRHARGWRLLESRWEVSHGRAPASEGAPLWLGDQPLEGRTILLRSEQGLGDTLQFCRYASQVKARGARVLLRAPRTLLPLLRSLDGVDALYDAAEPPPPADLHCFLMSLPLALGLAEPQADAVPYLSAEPAKVAAWRARLGPATRPRVGLVWSAGKRGSPQLDWPGRRRDAPLAQLRAFAGLDVQFVSLQKGEPAESELRGALAAGWEGPEILDAADALRDFGDTAALVEALDLVVSVDTAVAHLAGALGKPLWLLNRFDTCWRWAGGEASPWYPTARIYRQTVLGDWSEPFRRVRADLQALALS